MNKIEIPDDHEIRERLWYEVAKRHHSSGKKFVITVTVYYDGWMYPVTALKGDDWDDTIDKALAAAEDKVRRAPEEGL